MSKVCLKNSFKKSRKKSHFFCEGQLRVIVCPKTAQSYLLVQKPGNRSILLRVCENLVDATNVSSRKNETLAVYYFWNISYVQAQRYVCQSRQRQEI